MIRLVVYSDLHLHTWGDSTITEDGRNSRLDWQQNVLGQINLYCLQHDIDHLICCGDVFHTQGKVDSEVLMAAYESFSIIRENGIRQFWIVGNHDQKDKAGTIHSLPFLRELGTVVDEWFVYGDRKLFLMAHTHRKEMLEWAFNNHPGYTFFIHQGVSQIPLSNGHVIEEIFDSHMIPDTARHVFAGHYHTFKRVSSKLTIPGAPMQHTRGDRGQVRGWLDVTIPDEGPLDIKHIESDHPKFPEDKEIREERASKELNIDMSGFMDDMDRIIDEYVQQRKLDSHTKSIGRDLAEGKYEVPEPENR